MLDELAADGVPDTGRDTGMLVVATACAAVERAREEMEPLVATGEPPPGEILGADAVRALEPVLSSAIAGGFVVERHRQVDPWPLSRALVAHLAGRGVRFVEGVAVTAVDAGGPVVRLGAGDQVLAPTPSSSPPARMPGSWRRSSASASRSSAGAAARWTSPGPLP